MRINLKILGVVTAGLVVVLSIYSFRVMEDQLNSEIVNLCFDDKASLIIREKSNLECLNKLNVNSNYTNEYELDIKPLQLKKWNFISLDVNIESQSSFSSAMKVIDNLGIEHITSPYVENPNRANHVINLPKDTLEKLKLRFESGGTQSYFSNLRIKFSYDVRFDDIPQGEFRFRERLENKNNKTRVLVVGNSTIRGTCNSIQDTIPYLLQSKADFNSPGKFEFINYGIGSWFLASQVLAVNKTVVNEWPIDHTNIFKTDLGYTDDIRTLNSYRKIKISRRTIKSLKPDVIILASLWNDISHIKRHTHKVSCGDLSSYNECITNLGQSCEKKVPLISYYDSLYQFANTKKIDDEFVIHQKILNDRDCPIPKLADPNTSIVAKLTYRWLIDKFIEEVGEDSKIILLSLPFKGEGRLPSLYARDNASYLNIGTDKIGKNANIEQYDDLQFISAVQNEVMQKIAFEKNITFIDMSKVTRIKFTKASDKEYIDSDLFCDPIHFNERGNQFLVDNMFDKIGKELYLLKKNKSPSKNKYLIN